MFFYKKAAEKNFKDDPEIFNSVKEIIENVRNKGDEALSHYNEKFGGIAMDSFRVPEEDIEKASLLVKCIQQRSNALRLLLEKLVVMQKDYVLSGEK